MTAQLHVIPGIHDLGGAARLEGVPVIYEPNQEDFDAVQEIGYHNVGQMTITLFQGGNKRILSTGAEAYRNAQLTFDGSKPGCRTAHVGGTYPEEPGNILIVHRSALIPTRLAAIRSSGRSALHMSMDGGNPARQMLEDARYGFEGSPYDVCVVWMDNPEAQHGPREEIELATTGRYGDTVTAYVPLPPPPRVRHLRAVK